MSQAARPASAPASPAGHAANGAGGDATACSGANPLRRSGAVLAVAAVGAGVIAALGGGAAVRSWAQLGTFVVLVVLLWPLAVGGIRIPRVVLVGAALAALGGAVLRLVAFDISSQSFVVAQLREDSLQADAKILRDRMRNAAPAAAPVHIGTIYHQVANAQEAQALLDQDPSVWGVAWGSPRWTSVTLRSSPPLAVASLPADSYARLGMQRLGMADDVIVVSVPTIGISDAKLPATGEFLGKLAQVWPRFSSQIRSGGDQPSLETELRSLAAIRASWASNAHRALPMWMTGTLHLVRAVSGPEMQEAELLCAVRAFNAALAQLRPGDNRELRMAIRNNLALATRFRGGVDLGVKQSQAQARAILEGGRKKKRIGRKTAATLRWRRRK